MVILPTDYSLLSPDFMLDAIESVGIRIDSGLLELNSYENRVFQFLDEDKKRYVVKFYRPLRWSDEQIQEEHDFLFALQDAEVDVVAPFRFSGQSLLVHQGYRFVLYPSVGGRPLEVDNLDSLASVGSTLGRLHQVAKQQNFKHRPTIATSEYIDLPRQALFDGHFVPVHLENQFYDVYDKLGLVVKKQYEGNHSLIRLHGDLHAGNIIWRDSTSFVDFDDCRQGPAVQDLWMMLHGERREQQLQLDTLLEGYEEFTDFDTQELALIEPLRAMRMMHYMGWIARRWDDPAFKRHFAWFEDNSFWQQQVNVLQEQIDNMNNLPLSLMLQ